MPGPMLLPCALTIAHSSATNACSANARATYASTTDTRTTNSLATHSDASLQRWLWRRLQLCWRRSQLPGSSGVVGQPGAQAAVSCP